MHHSVVIPDDNSVWML